jgi:hypothetical protein
VIIAFVAEAVEEAEVCSLGMSSANRRLLYVLRV